MAKFTAREKELIRIALRIACEDGSIYPTGDDYEDDDKLKAQVQAEIDGIIYKLYRAR